MLDWPRWTNEQLEAERQKAIDVFRKLRMTEPLEAYLDAFGNYQGVVEDLLETTVDLSQMREHAVAILTNKGLLEALRYLPGPPISTDDLKTVADAKLTAKNLRVDTEMVQRIVGVILDGLDRRRFPWVAENREPTEQEREAAVLASAALMATRKTETIRRHVGKNTQEDAVSDALEACGLTKVPTRRVEPGLAHAPAPGEFCRESYLGERKADFIIRLWDHRMMPIECKVSNSATNSVKRLNNDAAAKAVEWRRVFGEGVVPSAVLGGVYKLGNLESAQRTGLALFWEHDLKTLLDWIDRARP